MMFWEGFIERMSCCLYRMTSLSMDYYLTLVLAVVLGVKYIVFDRDDDVSQSSQDGATVTSMSAGDHVNTTSVAASALKTGSASAGQTEQIDVTSDVTVNSISLHREASDDFTPTASSLHGTTTTIYYDVRITSPVAVNIYFLRQWNT